MLSEKSRSLSTTDFVEMADIWNQRVSLLFSKFPEAKAIYSAKTSYQLQKFANSVLKAIQNTKTLKQGHFDLKKLKEKLKEIKSSVVVPTPLKSIDWTKRKLVDILPANLCPRCGFNLDTTVHDCEVKKPKIVEIKKPPIEQQYQWFRDENCKVCAACRQLYQKLDISTGKWKYQNGHNHSGKCPVVDRKPSEAEQRDKRTDQNHARSAQEKSSKKQVSANVGKVPSFQAVVSTKKNLPKLNLKKVTPEIISLLELDDDEPAKSVPKNPFTKEDLAMLELSSRNCCWLANGEVHDDTVRRLRSERAWLADDEVHGFLVLLYDRLLDKDAYAKPYMYLNQLTQVRKRVVGKMIAKKQIQQIHLHGNHWALAVLNPDPSAEYHAIIFDSFQRLGPVEEEIVETWARLMGINRANFKLKYENC